MTAREALLRGIVRAIAQGHTHSVDPAHVTDFINQLQKDSPELLVAEGLQHVSSLNNRQQTGPVSTRARLRNRPQSQTEI